MNGAICLKCKKIGENHNLRRVNKASRHKDAKAGKPRLYKCKGCNSVYDFFNKIYSLNLSLN